MWLVCPARRRVIYVRMQQADQPAVRPPSGTGRETRRAEPAHADGDVGEDGVTATARGGLLFEVDRTPQPSRGRLNKE